MVDEWSIALLMNQFFVFCIDSVSVANIEARRSTKFSKPNKNKSKSKGKSQKKQPQPQQSQPVEKRPATESTQTPSRETKPNISTTPTKSTPTKYKDARQQQPQQVTPAAMEHFAAMERSPRVLSPMPASVVMVAPIADECSLRNSSECVAKRDVENEPYQPSPGTDTGTLQESH
jgi:hypothetical protein